MGSLNIRVNRQPLSHYGDWGNPTITWRWPLGSWELTWEMKQTTRSDLQHAMLNPLRIQVDADIDGQPVWAGNLPIADPAVNENTTTYTALGAAREAEEAAAVGTSGNGYPTCSVPRTATQNAINRGILTWRNIDQLSPASYVEPDQTPDDTSDDTDAINYLGALLDAWTQSVSMRWAITSVRDALVKPDPVNPEAALLPGTAAIGITAEAVVGRIFARYTISADDTDTTDVDESVYGTIAVGAGWPEKIVDYTDQGPLTAGQVTQRLAGIQAKYSREQVGWKNGFTVVPGQVTNMGGTPIHLGLLGAKVGRGLMIRINDQADPRNPGSYTTDAVAGQAIWHVNDDTLDLSPVDSLDDTFETALSDSGATLLS